MNEIPQKAVFNAQTGEMSIQYLTDDEIAQRQADADADVARRLAQYRELRAAAFAIEADPLFFQEQRGELPTGIWRAKVEEIRLRYPSGGQA